MGHHVRRPGGAVRGFAGQRLFSLCHQPCALVAVGAAVLFERRRMPFPPRSALMAPARCWPLGARLLPCATFSSPGSPRPARVRPACCSGLGLGSSYVLVAAVLRLRGGIAHGVLHPPSALFLVALSVALHALPEIAQAVCTMAVLPVAAAVSLGR
ncbi:MAG: hypothetical protein V8S24_16745 [Gordonibacter pamelaeae]